jgi:hypothetical protein
MLMIGDASPHRWFFDEREFSLHGAIDDATGEILSLFFTPHECMEGYFEVVRDIVTNHGVPLAFYVDRHTIFRAPSAEKFTIEDELSGKKIKDTQFGRAMRSLGINLIYAQTPQAKGRIERLWETLQSRLPVELNLAGINTLDDANIFLKAFIGKYNQKFAVKPADPKSDFRPLSKNLSLDYIFCTKETREADNGSSFCYDGSFYRLVRNGKIMPVIPKAKIIVMKSSRIGIKAEYSGIIYDVELIVDKQQKRVRNCTPAPKRPTQTSSTTTHSSLVCVRASGKNLSGFFTGGIRSRNPGSPVQFYYGLEIGNREKLFKCGLQ